MTSIDPKATDFHYFKVAPTKHKHTVGEGLRMTGQLLIHHPTTGAYAKNKQGQPRDLFRTDVHCWCLMGALSITAEVLGISHAQLEVAAFRSLRRLNKEWWTDRGLVHGWDTLDKMGRRTAAWHLAYRGDDA